MPKFALKFRQNSRQKLNFTRQISRKRGKYTLERETMQVNYKTISTLEFDVLTNSYKTVDKQVEDSSGFTDNAFYELLMGLEGGNAIEAGSDFDFSGSLMSATSPQSAANSELGTSAVNGMGEASLGANLDASGVNSSLDRFSSNLLSLKFSSNELFAVNNDAESIKSSLMSELLSAI